MNIHFLQHVPFEGLGSIRDWIERGGHKVACTRLYAGDGFPRPDSVDLLIVMGGPMGVYDEEAQAAEEKNNITVVPLGIPLLTGPGAVSGCINNNAQRQRIGPASSATKLQ